MPTVVERTCTGTISTKQAKTIPNHISAVELKILKLVFDCLVHNLEAQKSYVITLTEEIADAEVNHGPEWFKEYGTECKWCRDQLTDCQHGYT